jgi:Uma2 family endonuclease
MIAETPTVVLMTTEELLKLPEDDGTERELIRGELRERPMTKRNRIHTAVESMVAYYLNAWRLTQPEPRGRVHSGEAGCILRRNPDTTVGVDVVYLSPQQAAAVPAGTTLIDGPPVLAVEILSPTDRQDEITEKVQEYLTAGVAHVWVIEPIFRTAIVYRPGGVPEPLNETGELTAEPHLPGFRVRVADLFR